MLGKVKDILGIEGVKIELICPEVIPDGIDKIEGIIKLTTVREQEVKRIDIKLIEKYARGRKEKKLIDEYVLGEFMTETSIKVIPGQEHLLDFVLDFTRAKSPMDKMQDDSIIYKGLISVAKFFKKVKSTHRIEGIANVKGTKLDPNFKKPIQIRG